jgi:hypothetical protein
MAYDATDSGSLVAHDREPAGHEAARAEHDRSVSDAVRPGDGLDPRALSEDELLRELASLHGTRHETFRHGSDAALTHHDRRTAELEREYLRRFPDREVDPRRVRD